MQTCDIEKKIIIQTLESLVAHGFYLRAFDGCQYATDITQDKDAILAECFATGMTRIYVYTLSDDEEFADDPMVCSGWVEFIHGNGPYVLSNYTVELEEVLRLASDLAETFM